MFQILTDMEEWGLSDDDDDDDDDEEDGDEGFYLIIFRVYWVSTGSIEHSVKQLFHWASVYILCYILCQVNHIHVVI